MRAFFAECVDNMHFRLAVEGLPVLLHLSLFVFFGGLANFLFKVEVGVFGYVMCWIGLFSSLYGLIYQNKFCDLQNSRLRHKWLC